MAQTQFGPVSRRSLLSGALALGGATVLGGCGGSAATSSPTTGRITVRDQRGKSLTFDRPVTRVVTMPEPAAAIMIGVDRSANHLVGMHEGSWVAIRDGIMGDMFPHALKIAHNVAGQDFVPNVESILKLNPDVVVQWGDHGEGLISPMENAGLTVAGLSYGTQGDVATWLNLFAAMLGKPDRGKAMNTRIQGQLHQLKALGASRQGTKPRIMYFLQFVEDMKVTVSGGYNDWYIDLVGAVNPASQVSGSGGWATVGMEQVLSWDPEVVLLGNFDAAEPKDLYGDKVWQSVSAVKNRRVYKVPLGGYRWDPPSHESPLMWRWLSQIAYPKASSDLRSHIVDDYRFFYGYTPSAAQMDKILWSDVNGDSAHYGQFDAT